VTSWGDRAMAAFTTATGSSFLASCKGPELRCMAFTWLDDQARCFKSPKRPVLMEVKVMSRWNLSARLLEPGAACSWGQCSPGGARFPRSSSRPRSGGGLKSIQTIPITLLSACFEGGHLRSGEEWWEGASPIRCGDRGAGAVRPWHNCCAGADPRAGTLTRRLRHRGAAGCEGHNKHCGRAAASESESAWIPPPDGLSLLRALIRWARHPDLAAAGIIGHQRSFCVIGIATYGSVSARLAGLRSRRRKSLRRRGLRR